ncbi:ATP-dependent DNA helicase RecG [Candidatus Parcubacteria bacterium]|nr:MAG: ATP-dependent DNA helicase RecG [Candidatus Parcubacteria bacterium]
MKLETLLFDVPGVGPRFGRKLAQLGLRTVQDLLWHFPSRYEDFSQIYRIADLEPGQQATIRGLIQDVEIRRTWRKRMTIIEAVIADNSGSIRAVWFNQPYLLNILRVGRVGNFAGKVSISDGELYLSHPTHEMVGRDEEAETRHTGRLVPIYPETRGLTSKGLRFLIQPLLKMIDEVPEWMPSSILEAQRLPEINQALRTIHFPEAIEDATAAKNRFSFEDLFLLQLFHLSQKLKLAREKAPRVQTDIERLKKTVEALPFTLTQTQKQSLWEILKDMEQPRPMNRLLQGDVGSGKTVVATLAALVVHENNFQTALMAPTEVLARQHFETLRNLLGKIGVHLHEHDRMPSVGMLTASGAEICYGENLSEKTTKSKLANEVRRGSVPILVGTHALIERSVKFNHLGLVVVDEQHRFGVRQRQALARGQSALVPHFLSMSATPIPRTLMLTVFGDLDISTITELPSGRKNIVTKVVSSENRPKAYAFIRGQVKRGRQAFVICPRIDPPKEDVAKTPQNRYEAFLKLDVKSVKEEYEKLSKKIFPDLRLAMLHGQMKSKEKESIMRTFRDGKTDILVSTSVVEVGVDVPNATIMMIEGSERFGLAQLYQFRGRVGRGGHQSFCFLFTDSNAKTTNARLKAILEAKNGFELAEKDLKIRGPGEFLGEAQTGLPDIAMKALEDIELVKSSREAAVGVLRDDPSLKNHPLLRERLSAFQKEIHLE